MDKKHSECFQLDARKDKKSFSSNVDFYAISIWNSCLSGNDEIEVHSDLLVEHAVLARKNRGGAHLWFVSVIFLCYLVTPLLQKIKKWLIIVISMLIVMGDGLCYLSHVGGMTILYTSVYIIGYYFRNKEKEITKVNAVAIIILSLIIRLVSMKYLDGTVIYDCLLVYLTHTALAIGLFSLGRRIFDLKSRSSIDWFDDISYFVYITHYMFMVGPLRTMGLTSNLLLNTIITVTLSFFLATLLQKIYRAVIMENIK